MADLLEKLGNDTKELLVKVNRRLTLLFTQRELYTHVVQWDIII